jgi:hypothetical protein
VSDEKADNEFRAHILGCVQLATFAIAACIFAMVYYDQPTRRDQVEKTKYVAKAEVETSFAMPKTLQAETQMMPMGGTTIPMYAVYGRDMTERRVWCATFIDMDEATAWVQASKVFGRAVKGAVISNQEKTDGEATVAEDASGIIGGEPTGAAN